MYKYTINDDIVVEFFKEGQAAPFIRQHCYPKGQPWSRYQAEQWANLKLEEMVNPQSKWVAGNSPDDPMRLRKFPTDTVDETIEDDVEPVVEEPTVDEPAE